MDTQRKITSFEGLSFQGVEEPLQQLAPPVISAAPVVTHTTMQLFMGMYEKLLQEGASFPPLSEDQAKRILQLQQNKVSIFQGNSMAAYIELFEHLMLGGVEAIDESISQLEQACQGKHSYIWELRTGRECEERFNLGIRISEMKSQGIESDEVCPRCKMNRVLYSEMQIRKPDEPATAMLYCLNCTHRWIIS